MAGVPGGVDVEKLGTDEEEGKVGTGVDVEGPAVAAGAVGESEASGDVTVTSSIEALMLSARPPRLRFLTTEVKRFFSLISQRMWRTANSSSDRSSYKSK